MTQEKESNIENNSDKEIVKEVTKRSLRSIVGEFVLYFILFFACFYIIPEYVMQRTIVDGSSMTKTLQDQDNLLVNKLEYRISDPERYDIVVFYPYGREEEEYYVKRIYGLPGETIQIVDGSIYVNGNVIKDNFVKNTTKDPGLAEDPIQLAEDEYFVLGDNRQGSSDSRDFGPVKRENIAGHVVLRIWPLSKFGTLKGEDDE